jgi:hypothetical protein
MLTILWHDVDSAGYTDHIESQWLASDGAHSGITHCVTGPRSGRYKAKCDISVSGHLVDCNYERYEQFNNDHGMFLGVMRIQFADSSRQNITQILWKEVGKKRFAPCSTTATFVADDPSEFDALVARSSRLSSKARRKRLAGASKKPARMQIVSTAFLRNPDVVAEVLHRAAGFCECCKQPAPFRRAKDDQPYLEVHHRIRLADGGDDTIENAVALCPNCHRKAHYG